MTGHDGHEHAHGHVHGHHGGHDHGISHGAPTFGGAFAAGILLNAAIIVAV